MRSLIFLGLALLAAPAAAAEPYAVDMAAVRQLADQTPGDRPTEIRVEHVGDLPFTWDEVVEGAEKAPINMALLSYQIVFPNKTGLVDVTMDKAIADAWGAGGWDAAASDRLDAAMAKADFIVVTHEHADHIGRVVSHADSKELMAHARLTEEQLGHPEMMDPLKWPEGALAGYTALAYQGMAPIAPGVVVIKAPGHTPGSQIVFVRTAAGQEYLFLGDAVWQWRNIAEGKSRGAEAVKMLGEDEAAVKAQIAEFQRLVKDEPALIMVPGHDGALIEKLVADGKLVSAFK